MPPASKPAALVAWGRKLDSMYFCLGCDLDCRHAGQRQRGGPQFRSMREWNGTHKNHGVAHRRRGGRGTHQTYRLSGSRSLEGREAAMALEAHYAVAQTGFVRDSAVRAKVSDAAVLDRCPAVPIPPRRRPSKQRSLLGRLLRAGSVSVLLRCFRLPGPWCCPARKSLRESLAQTLRRKDPDRSNDQQW